MRRRSIFKFLRSSRAREEKGVALMVVLGAVIVLTMISVEFVYDAQIDFHLALRQKERLQAYYLAQSAYNLTLLELKLGSQAQEQLANFLKSANVQLGVDLSAPLCQQLPINTALFRVAMGGEGVPKEGEEKKEGEENLLGTFPLSGLEDFMQFKGDFSAECADESSKIDLNYFYEQDPAKEVINAENPYDDYKKFIIKVLSQSTYSVLFEEAQTTPQEVVRNIADWIDQNENINEFGRQERGGEDTIYRGGQPGQMTTKNGKFSTPLEIYEVSGISESLWIPLANLFTIYAESTGGEKSKINVCRAPEEVVKGLILRYAETRSDLPPIKPEEEAEVLSKLVEKVKEGCQGAKPDPNEIAAALDGALGEVLKVGTAPGGAPPGGAPGGVEKPEEKPEEGAPPEGAPGEGGAEALGGAAGGGGAGGGQKSSSAFAEWIATESHFYSLHLTGEVGKATVRIHAVIDVRGEGDIEPEPMNLEAPPAETGAEGAAAEGEKKPPAEAASPPSDASQWKLVYWKVY